MKTAIIFPGQGVQFIGMAKDFVDNFNEAKDVFMLANETLNRDLYKLVMEGDIDNLNITKNTQPAIITAEMAMLEVFLKHLKIGDVTAGLSLGEYSSLIFSGVMKFTDVLPLVEKRGELMLSGYKGKMAAIISYDREKLIGICKKLTDEGSYVVPANFNSIDQIVISGSKEGVEKAMELTKSEGARVVPLNINSPFHTNLLEDASISLGRLLENVEIKKPEIPVYFNTIADMEEDPMKIKGLLIRQVMSSVLWIDTMFKMLDRGVNNFIEIGPGKTLTGFLKKLPYEYRVYNINNIMTLEKTLNNLGG